MAEQQTPRGALSPALWVIAVVAVTVVGAIWMVDATPRDGRPTESVARPAVPVLVHPELVHLGDSYASGAGTSPLVADSPIVCQRSQQNFGQVVARMRGLRLTDVSCAGATTEDLSVAQYDGVPPQLDALSADTAYVTITIGGNDSGLFATLVGECTRLARTDPYGAPCRETLGQKPFQELSGSTRPAVADGLRAIAARAPHAEVVLVGYPRLMPAARACRPAVGIADGDVEYVDRVQAALDAALRSAAAEAGATYVDMSARSVGHDACEPKGARWVEPQIGGTSRIVMHPNAAGQQAIADAVAARIG